MATISRMAATRDDANDAIRTWRMGSFEPLEPREQDEPQAAPQQDPSEWPDRRQPHALRRG